MSARVKKLFHVGLKITRLSTGRIMISNPKIITKIITKILKEKGLDGSNSTSVPYLINVDLKKRKEHEPTVDTKKYMKRGF